MTLAAPFWLWLGAGVAVAVVALHFLARRQPPAATLPTARFVPERAVRWPSFARRLSDLPLLLVRLAAVVLAALAFVRPGVDRERPVRRVVLADGSALVGDTAEVRDSVAAWARPGDTVVTDASGRLSAGLIRALRAARAVRARADSVELVIVSPFVVASIDAATEAIRAEWRGRARLVRVAPARADEVAVQASLDPADPLAATIALAALPLRPDAAVRVLRRLPAAGDSAFARAGGTLVVWPGDAPATGDTVLAVAAGDVAVVAPFPRGRPLATGRALARWIDGTPAATERPLGAGCVREVAVPMPAAGDLPLRPATVRLARRLLAPCGGPPDLTPATPAVMEVLQGAGPLLAAGTLPEPAPARVPAAPWLLAAALAVFALEPLARRSSA